MKIFQTFYRLVLLSLFIIPIIILLYHAGWDFAPYTNYVFSQLTNTILLVTLTAFFTLIIGGISAWFVALYNFPFKRIIETSYILMMLFPSYVISMMMGDISSTLLGFWGLVLTMTLVTIPYVFLILTMSLRSQSQILVDTALMFGKNKNWIKLKLILPLLKPAIMIALIFVVSDTISEFGATHFMGVDTFMTGIYEIWLGLYEYDIGLKLSSLIFILIVVVVYSSNLFGKDKHLTNPTKSKTIEPIQLSGFKAWLVTFITVIPITIGFLIPLIMLVDWNISAWGQTDWLSVGWVSLQTIMVAGVVSITSLFLATEFLYYFKKDERKAKIIYSLISSMYAMPGIVVAVTMLWLVGFLDFQWLGFIYLYALIVKYIALSMDSVYTGLQKIDRVYYYSSKGFGKNSNWYKWYIQMPLAKKSYVVGGILVWIDVMRELVIGYALRPDWLDLLSVKIYSFIDVELMYLSGPWILMMVIITLIPIWWVNKIIKMGNKI